MRGQWLSTTRKLNRHYQSGVGITPTPLWDVCLLNCGGVATQSGFNYGLTFDKDGIHFGGFGTGGGKAQIDIAPLSIINLQGNILPIWYIMCDNITIDGVQFPDVTGKTLINSGALKWKYDNVTLTYTIGSEIRTWSGRVLLIYIDLVDVPMQSQYVTQRMIFNNVHFDIPYRKDQRQPIRYGVANNNLYVYEDDLSAYTTGTIFYDKMFTLNQQTLYVDSTPPAINCGVNLVNPISYGYGRDPFFGQYGVSIYDPLDLNTYNIGLIEYVGTNSVAVYDNYFVGGTGLARIGIDGFHTVTISDGNGLYFDYMCVPTIDHIREIQTGNATQTKVIMWQ